MATDTLQASPLKPLPEFADILRETETYGTGTGSDSEDRINNWFDSLMVQSGLEISPALLLMLTVFSAMTLGGLVFVVQENLLTTALASLLGSAIPVTWAIIARFQRQKKMLNQLPEMVDELARAARTGRSIEQCFTLVAADTPTPLGEELRLCACKLDMGIGLRGALTGLPERTGLVSLNILVMALSVHLLTGGDLVGVLERLSRTVRERIQFLGRVRAATAASRATALLMVILPPGIFAFFLFRDPEYLTKLFDARWGRLLTIMAFVLDVIGVVWVVRILRSSSKT